MIPTTHRNENYKYAIVLYAALIFGCLSYAYYLNTLSSFPLGLHPDEMRKVAQIQDGKKYFYHPQLLIELNRLFSFLLGSFTDREIAITGRMLSNLLAGSTIFFFSIAARNILDDKRLLIIFPLLMMTSVPLLVGGRYIKEDICYFSSLSFNAFALSIFLNDKKRVKIRHLNSILLGASYGLLLSSKYAAIAFCLAQIFSIYIFQLHDKKNRIDSRWMFASTVLIIALVNRNALKYPITFLEDLFFEFQHARAGQFGIRFEYYSPTYIFSMLESFSFWGILSILAIWVMFGLNLQCISPNVRRFVFIFGAGSLAYLALVQIAPLKGAVRYIQPFIIAISFLTYLIALNLISCSKLHKFVSLAALVLLVVSQLKIVKEVHMAIHFRTHQIAQDWLSAIKNKNKRTLAESHAGIGFRNIENINPDIHVNKADVTVIWNLASFCKKNDCSVFDYKVIACNNFHKYFQKGATLSVRAQAEKDFYERLLKNKNFYFSVGHHGSVPVDRWGVFEGGCVYIF